LGEPSAGLDVMAQRKMPGNAGNKKIDLPVDTQFIESSDQQSLVERNTVVGKTKTLWEPRAVNTHQSLKSCLFLH
jgi:hypothetical protein